MGFGEGRDARAQRLRTRCCCSSPARRAHQGLIGVGEQAVRVASREAATPSSRPCRPT